jgi:hypothetical protein
MARPERFELPTFWFVARHSIQLSYGRGKARYYVEAPGGRQGNAGSRPSDLAKPHASAIMQIMNESSGPDRKFRGWRLLAVLVAVIAVLAITSFIIDWMVIGPLEGRMY